MPENGYFHQNKAVSAVIQAVPSCSCMPQIRKSVITLWIRPWSIQERDKGIALAELKRYFNVRLIVETPILMRLAEKERSEV
jgi:hypothetical protein